ncbi:unnamed protein product, partial [Hapterophycus canaliculatus]
PTGRTSYEIRQKVQALEFSRLRCTDGAEVGKRGAAAVLGINVRLLRSWEEQESELRKSLAAAGYHAGPSRSLHTGRSSPTEKVEDAIVDEVNTLSKQGVAVSSKIVMRKLLELMPNFQGGLPSADKAVEVEVFEKKFKRWYYRFLKRHRFSIRRKTSVGQKKPEGWEGKAWAFIQKLRARLLHHAKEAILVFGILYNMDQTPIQAEMPQETTVAPTGAKDARIATAGKEKLRYTVVLAVRGDGQKVKPRIIYKGSPLSYHHLPANRTKYGYPPAGIGLGVQKSSWCDARQTDIWLTEEFMRRPDATGFSQPVSILTMDDFKCHKDEEFQKKLKERAKTEPIMIPGGLTPVVQPLDRTVNKEFKRGMRAKYTHWRKEEFERVGAAGKIEAPGRGIVARWVKDVWGSISAETIRTCFKACGLTLNLDGSDDH